MKVIERIIAGIEADLDQRGVKLDRDLLDRAHVRSVWRKLILAKLAIAAAEASMGGGR